MKDGVVTFDNKDYVKYVAENWNAVVLYNLIYYIYENQESEDKCTMAMFYNEYIENKKLQNICGEKFVGDIERAFRDITEYDKSLDIIKHVRERTIGYERKCRVKRICENYNRYGLAKIEMINHFAYKNAAKPGQDGINIYVENGKIARAVVYADDAMYSCDFDDYINIETNTKIADYEYPRASKDARKKILDSINPYSRKDKYIKLTPTTKRINDILDVGWYTDENGIVHLAWLDVDGAYLNHAYIDNRYQLNLNFDLEDEMLDGIDNNALAIDERCFQSSIVSERIDMCGDGIIDTPVQINITNPRQYKLIMPKKCELLICCAHSLKSIDLTKADFSQSEGFIWMVSSNDNLKSVIIPEIQSNKYYSYRPTEGMIEGNLKLESVYLKLPKSQAYEHWNVIINNKGLREIRLDLRDVTINDMEEIGVMLKDNGKDELQITLIVPWDKTKLLHEYSMYKTRAKRETLFKGTPQNTTITIYTSEQNPEMDTPALTIKEE